MRRKYEILKKNLKIVFFSIFKQNHKKNQTTFHQYQKQYSTPHAMVHARAKFGENTSMRFRVTVRKLNVTDRRTDGRTDGRGGGVVISPVPGPTARNVNDDVSDHPCA